jgi:hypothetical protein
MSFATNHITDKFKGGFIRTKNLEQSHRAQELMFKLGFKWASGCRTKFDYSNGNSFLMVDEDCRITNCPQEQRWEPKTGEFTFFGLREAVNAVKAIRKARKKDQRKRAVAKRAEAVMLAEGWIKNTGVQPTIEGKVEVMFNRGQTNARHEADTWWWGVGASLGCIAYYRPVQEPVTLQAMVADVVEAAGGTETVQVGKDGFISWNGGECPVPDGTRVDVRYRDGERPAFNVRANEFEASARDASSQFWQHDGAQNDIVAYRVCPVVTPAKEAYPDRGFVHHDEDSPPDTNPKKQYGLASIPLNMWSNLASAYGSLALYNGSLKYGKANFANTPVEASIYIAAIKRHLASWEAGEEFDPADGVPHLGGVLANVAILVEARAAGMLIDDRLKMAGYLKERDALKALVPQIAAVHEGKNPKHYTVGG